MKTINLNKLKTGKVLNLCEPNSYTLTGGGNNSCKIYISAGVNVILDTPILNDVQIYNSGTIETIGSISMNSNAVLVNEAEGVINVNGDFGNIDGKIINSGTINVSGLFGNLNGNSNVCLEHGSVLNTKHLGHVNKSIKGGGGCLYFTGNVIEKNIDRPQRFNEPFCIGSLKVCQLSRTPHENWGDAQVIKGCLTGCSCNGEESIEPPVPDPPICTDITIHQYGILLIETILNNVEYDSNNELTWYNSLGNVTDLNTITDPFNLSIPQTMKVYVTQKNELYESEKSLLQIIIKSEEEPEIEEPEPEYTVPPAPMCMTPVTVMQNSSIDNITSKVLYDAGNILTWYLNTKFLQIVNLEDIVSTPGAYLLTVTQKNPMYESQGTGMVIIVEPDPNIEEPIELLESPAIMDLILNFGGELTVTKIINCVQNDLNNTLTWYDSPSGAEIDLQDLIGNINTSVSGIIYTLWVTQKNEVMESSKSSFNIIVEPKPAPIPEFGILHGGNTVTTGVNTNYGQLITVNETVGLDFATMILYHNGPSTPPTQYKVWVEIYSGFNSSELICTGIENIITVSGSGNKQERIRLGCKLQPGNYRIMVKYSLFSGTSWSSSLQGLGQRTMVTPQGNYDCLFAIPIEGKIDDEVIISTVGNNRNNTDKHGYYLLEDIEFSINW